MLQPAANLLLMPQIGRAVVVSFILRAREQMQWLETRLDMLSPGSDRFDREQRAIRSAMNELRKLIWHALEEQH